MTARKAVTRSGRGVRGYSASLKMRKMIPWESTLERDAILHLEFSQGIKNFWAQPQKFFFYENDQQKFCWPYRHCRGRGLCCQQTAVEGLTKSAALEGAERGVRVNAVAPGPVATDMLDRFTGGNEEAKAGFLSMIPAKRAATPDEIAQTIVFLASDKARYLTGQSVAIDGAYLAQ